MIMPHSFIRQVESDDLVGEKLINGCSGELGLAEAPLGFVQGAIQRLEAAREQVGAIPN